VPPQREPRLLDQLLGYPCIEQPLNNTHAHNALRSISGGRGILGSHAPGGSPETAAG
jgi:hypothetical protein